MRQAKKEVDGKQLRALAKAFAQAKCGWVDTAPNVEERLEEWVITTRNQAQLLLDTAKSIN